MLQKCASYIQSNCRLRYFLLRRIVLRLIRLLTIVVFCLRFQAVLVTVVLLGAFGNDGHRLNFGIQDFLGVGTSLGLAFATPLVLLAYLFGGSLLVMVRKGALSSNGLEN